MIVEEFVTKDDRPYRFKIGTIIASSLAGFVAGIIFGGIAIWLIFWALQQSR